ncbi:uncharacterized protein LOC113750512 [Coffea eugenioides]|uniref:uncharacterized protein LOC113750512 n=1 Tax=Coffea eugenioides TaxID=49369 RepID=UPI000F6045F3|nr:uncharacterized protein LOC113750512 [Coffea eugenioides]
MTDILERLANQLGHGTVNQTVNLEGREDRALDRFQRFSSPKFSGGSDPKMAEGWLERIADIFAALNYTEERQVAFAVFQFEGATRSWWNMIRARERKDDFIKCKQGSLSVAEYETLFIKLSKFAPELVAAEQRRIRRFIQGLNMEIQEGLAATQITSFSDAIERAQRIESAKAQVKAFNARKRNAPSGSRGLVDANALSPKFGRGVSEVNTSGNTKSDDDERSYIERGIF